MTNEPVKRYDVAERGSDELVVESANGDYVVYEDVKAEIERLQGAVARACQLLHGVPLGAVQRWLVDNFLSEHDHPHLKVTAHEPSPVDNPHVVTESSGETNYILGCANCGREYFADGAPACDCRSARTSPADLVGALQDVVHTDPGPVRAGRAVKGEPCEVDQLRAALRWLMLDNCFTDTSAAFDSDMPKPAGVEETLERERLALYPPSQRTSE